MTQTQEEKAKRYDEALERARALNNGEAVNIKIGTTTCEYIFPELKESEDERIRKELIGFVKSRLAGFPECGRFITWLEKQDTFSKKDVDDAYLKGITDAKNEIEKQYEIIFPTKLKGGEDKKIRKAIYNAIKYLETEHSWDFLDDVDILDAYAWLEKQDTFSKKDVDLSHQTKRGELTWLTRYIEEEVYSLSMGIRDDEDRIKLKNLKKSLDWLEKQGEKPQGKSALEAIKEEKVDNQNCVKPTDKVEPRFHEGDWVVDNYNCVWKIEGILNQFYLLEGVEGGESCPTINWVDKTFRLWNIQDAKNGDVLFHSDSASNGIFIFKEILQPIQKVMCYCDYDSEDGFCLGENHTCCWADSKILHPATKEQRNLLFLKMKEAGYKWDAANKELKKEV